MVLRAALLAFAALLASCLAGTKAVRAPTRTPVTVVLVRDGAVPVETPSALAERLAAVLDERNLAPTFVPPARWADAFATKRTTAQRLAHVASVADTEWILLVETGAEFYSQLNGRFRWTVRMRASFAQAAAPERPTQADDTFSAFVDFDHQRESEAVRIASARIAEAVGALADGVVPTLAAPAAPKAEAKRGVLYFVMVDRFANGDPSNDGEIDLTDPEAFHGGDLQGVLDKVDYLQALGVETVWLSPVSKMRTAKLGGHGAFHGYWVEDLGELEPRFGSKALLRRLRDELHARGMKLVLDLVLNHVGYDAPLVAKKPEWFHRKGDIEDWTDRTQLETHDVHGLPDLAQENEEVYAHLVAASKRWIDDIRPDGFRLDAVKHVPTSFWARYNDAIRAHAGNDFMLLGEAFDGDPNVLARTWREGRFSHMFDFPLYFATVDAFCRDRSMGRIAGILSLDQLYERPDRLVTLLDNHDLPRIATACGADTARIDAALGFLRSVRGTPSITYGFESMLAGEREPMNRGDMRFTANADLRGRPTVRLHGAPRVVHSTKDRLVLSDDVRTLRVERRTGPTLVSESTPPPLAAVINLRVSAAPEADALVLVGGAPELGAWNPARGIALSSDETQATLPTGRLYLAKLAARRGTTWEWESGTDRELLVVKPETFAFTWNEHATEAP